MLRLLLGSDWIAVKNEILGRIADDVAAQRGGRILMVPELISHDTERRLCEAAGDTASRFAEVLSFTRLARRVSDHTGCKLQECLDNGGRVVAMAAAARQLHSKLKAYGAVQTRPEFLTGLVEAMDEFKRCCISAQDLLGASLQTQGAFAQKLEELSLLLEGYDSLCAQGKRDPRDQMNWLLEQLEAGDFGQRHVFYIDGFPDFTRQHLAILEYLIRVSPSVTVAMNCDCPDSHKLAFEKAGDTAAQLIRCARHAGVPVQIRQIPGRDTPLHAMAGSLFQGQLPENVSGVQAVKADSVWAEVELAAEKVMELVRGGCRYRDIGIVCGDMGVYQDLISLVFHRCGIPLYQSGTEDVLQKTLICTVLSAVDAALGGFEQRDVLSYLKSALSPLESEACDLVENYAVLWGIRGKHWLRDWTNHPDGLGGEWNDDAGQTLARLNEARKLALDPLADLEKKFREAKNLAGQVQALYDFLEQVQLAQRLDSLAHQLDEQGDNRSAQILDQLWEILLTALEQLYDVLGQTVWEPEAFVRMLTLLLRQYDVGTIPPVLDAVAVGSVSAMRCQQEKHLLVLGAEEGNLPGYSGAAGILSDQERVALRELGVPLTGGNLEGLQAEFAEIYGVFCGAEDSVTVYCSGEQPSYLYRRLAEMSGGECQKIPGVVAAAADPREAGIFLARWQAEDAAESLGVADSYRKARLQAAHTLGRISPKGIEQLYGSKLRLSASQIDTQAECRMRYFLKYGMRAKERKQTTVDPAEFGTYVHSVLENTARRVMELGGFHQISLDKTMEIAMEFSEEYAKSRFSELDSARLTYLFQRNRRELEMVVMELWQELKESAFRPKEFELGFGDREKMDAIAIPAVGMTAVLRGFVDRVDIWQGDDGCYFRVVDYKTGKKDFDYCDVFNGVGLQMLLYLFALEQAGMDIWGQRSVGAGVQYFPARAPLVSADGRLTDEEAELERGKLWKRKGLLLQDESVLDAMDPSESGRLCAGRKKDGTLTGDLATREQMKLLREYIFSFLGGMVDDIASGNIQPNPYTRGSAHNACDYCPYGAVCHGKNGEGRRNYKAMDARRFWTEVERKVTRHG